MASTLLSIHEMFENFERIEDSGGKVRNSKVR